MNNHNCQEDSTASKQTSEVKRFIYIGVIETRMYVCQHGKAVYD